MRYLTDLDLPTIECCEVEYEWDDREEECLMCGESFDWEDCASHWNESDLMEHERQRSGYDPAYDSAYDPDEEANTDPEKDKVVSNFEKWLKANSGPKEDDDEATLFVGKDFYHGVNLGSGPKSPYSKEASRAPTLGHRPVETKHIDPFLDTEMPDEIL